jgi:glycine betaine/choline ABC-type transport system substrate-binding protein
MGRAAILLLVSLVLISLLAGCAAKPKIVVGSKNFTEQIVLGEIIAGQIERRLGVEVDRKLNLGGTLLAHEAVKSGSIDLYPEYTGTALTAILKQAPGGNADVTFQKVREAYSTWNIAWLSPLGFDDGFAMVVRSQTAQEQNIKTLSDAAAHPWRLGVGYEFIQRPDGLDGLVRTYGLKIDGEPVTMDLGLLYPALQTKKIDMAAANATDGMLAHTEFVALVDDRHYFPPYECAIVVRTPTLQNFPALRAALEELSGRISVPEMRRMNEQVDVQHRSASEVARDFLNTWK